MVQQDFVLFAIENRTFEDVKHNINIIGRSIKRISGIFIQVFLKVLRAQKMTKIYKNELLYCCIPVILLFFRTKIQIYPIIFLESKVFDFEQSKMIETEANLY